MKRYTVGDILRLEPCGPYTRQKIQKLWGKRRSLSLVSILKFDIPASDKIWVVCRLLDKRPLVAWACDCAERVLPIFEREYPKDKRPRKAIRTTRKWLRGEATLEEVEVAADAATDAADVTLATYAAAYAAYAAYDGATHAAAHAARAAAYDAATHAVANAAADRAAECKWQLRRLLEYIRGEITA